MIDIMEIRNAIKTGQLIVSKEKTDFYDVDYERERTRTGIFIEDTVSGEKINIYEEISEKDDD